jgi:hypothetical protein
MKKIIQELRRLAFTLAIEEETQSKFGDHWGRKHRHRHNKLLYQLYKLEKRQ